MDPVFEWFAEPGRSEFATWLAAVVAVVVSFAALGIAAVSLRRQSARNKRIDAVTQQARIRAELVHEGGGAYTLHVINDGESEARDVVVEMDGAPLIEHPAFPGNQEPISFVGPRAYVRRLLVGASGRVPPWQISITWTDDSGPGRTFRSELS